MNHLAMTGALGFSALVGSIAVTRPASAFQLCNYVQEHGVSRCMMGFGQGQPIKLRYGSPGWSMLQWSEVSWMNTNYSFVQLVNGNGNNQCIGAAGGKIDNGTPIISWNCNNNLSSTDQAWHPVLAGYWQDSSVPCYYLVDEPTASWPTPRVIGVPAGNVVYNAGLVLWDHISSAPDQLWCVFDN